MNRRSQIADTVRQATEKAGALVIATLAIAVTALIVALAAMVLVLKVRRA